MEVLLVSVMKVSCTDPVDVRSGRIFYVNVFVIDKLEEGGFVGFAPLSNCWQIGHCRVAAVDCEIYFWLIFYQAGELN